MSARPKRVAAFALPLIGGRDVAARVVVVPLGAGVLAAGSVGALTLGAAALVAAVVVFASLGGVVARSVSSFCAEPQNISGQIASDVLQPRPLTPRVLREGRVVQPVVVAVAAAPQPPPQPVAVRPFLGLSVVEIPVVILIVERSISETTGGESVPLLRVATAVGSLTS